MTLQNDHISNRSHVNLPVTTRTTPDGAHFQHLRFWDSNQIGSDLGRLKYVARHISTVVSFRYVGLLLVAFGLASLVGCASADSSSPAETAPTLQLVVTKPDSIQVGLAVRYIAQSDESQCQSFTAESMSMKPIRRTSLIFARQPESNVFVPNDARVRVVPIDVTNTDDATMNRYTWVVSLSWFDEPKDCDFIPQRVSVDLFDPSGGMVGGTLLKARSWPAEREPAPTYVPVPGSILLQCSRQTRTDREQSIGDICQTKHKGADGFEIQAKRGDTTRVNVSIE